MYIEANAEDLMSILKGRAEALREAILDGDSPQKLDELADRVKDAAWNLKFEDEKEKPKEPEPKAPKTDDEIPF